MVGSLDRSQTIVHGLILLPQQLTAASMGIAQGCNWESDQVSQSDTR